MSLMSALARLAGLGRAGPSVSEEGTVPPSEKEPEQDRDGAVECADAEALRGPVIAALRTIHDPEIPVNIYDLGLVYRIEIEATGDVDIQMTLTAPACPVAGAMPRLVEEAVRKLRGVGDVRVELVWDPPWTQDRMTEEARLHLGMM